MKAWRYESLDRRLWICGARIHHGLVGFVLCAVGVALMVDDWHDKPWVNDC